MNSLPLITLATSTKPLLPSQLIKFLGYSLGSLILETNRTGIPGTGMRPSYAHLALGRLPLVSLYPLGLLVGHALGGNLHLFIRDLAVAATASTRTATGAGTERSIPLASASAGSLEHLGGVNAVFVHILLDLLGVACARIVLVPSPASDRAGLDGLVLSLVGRTGVAGDNLTLADSLNGSRLLFVKVRLRILAHGGGSLLLQQLSLFFFEFGKLFIYIRIDEVGNVLAVNDLRDGIEAPFLILEVINLAIIRCPNTRPAILPHEVACRLLDIRVIHGNVIGAIHTVNRSIILGGGITRPGSLGFAFIVGGSESAILSCLLNGCRNISLPSTTIPGGGFKDLQTVHYSLDLLTRDAALDASGKELVACGRLDIRQPLLGKVGHGH
mmetsp:Transcript_6058/g.13198  ORF Transcript_6058/g.13198 Transcript_6058/m.13198 type:complete len:385 (-) Transcript_6058:1221-2375(-)